MHARLFLLVIALSVQAAALSAMAALGDLGLHVPAFLALFALAGAAFLVALTTLRFATWGASTVILVAVLLRLPLAFTEPSLSDDVWRYLHDGRAQLAGVNPFLHAPADPATIAYRGPEHGRINSPELPTIYPPLSQIAFLAAAALGGTLWSWKILVLGVELLLMLGLAATARPRGDPRALALYAWHPLVIVEVAGSAHVEPIALAPVILAIALARRARPLAAGAALGAATAAKLLPLPLVAFVHHRRTPAVTAVAVAVLGALYAPYIAGAGGAVSGSLGTFARSWEFNAGAFDLLSRAPGGRTVAGIIGALGVVAVLAWLWHRRAPLESAAFGLFLAVLLLSPVVHPWYLLWALTLLPTLSEGERAGPAGAAVMAWSFSIVLAYTVLTGYRAGEGWMLSGWARGSEYGVVLVAAAVAAYRAARSREPGPDTRGRKERRGRHHPDPSS